MSALMICIGDVLVLPLRSSSRPTGDVSRLSLLDDRDLKFGGRFCEPRGPSLGPPVSDLDLDVDGLLREG